MSYVKVPQLVVSVADLAVEAGKVDAQDIPTPPKGIENKRRWFQAVIRNQTPFTILLTGPTHFDSGRYWDAPGSIPPFRQSKFSGCNGDFTFGTGVSGGNAWRISLDDEHKFDFALGWTSPQAGAFKAAVVASSEAKAGYDAASENGGSLTSKEKYATTDKDGKEYRFRFHISAAPGRNMVYTVSVAKTE